MSAVTAAGLGHRYGREHWALRHLDAELPAGSVTALVGANGAGKTTLLEMLAGVVSPSEGACCAGERVRLVAHDRPLHARMSAADHLDWMRRANTRWDDTLARAWLAQFEVPLERRCGRLSTGQRALVALALALGAMPSTLLLDEVLANLDPVIRVDVVAGLLRLNAESGTTIVLATHTPAELAGAADHLLLLAAGQRVLLGAIDDLLDRHRRYLGPRVEQVPLTGDVVHSSFLARQTAALVRHDRPPATIPQGWTARPVTLEELVVDYLRSFRAAASARAPLTLVDSDAS